MRELSVIEVQEVAGAGFIQDGLTAFGGNVGNAGYQAISPLLNVQLPIVGNVNLGSLFPNLGKEVGSNIGHQIGGQIETKLTSLPVLGGIFGKILG